jgi:hypothetical protein
MIQRLEAIDFVGEMSQVTGVNVAIGVNVYIEEPDPFSSYMVLVDPSGLSGEDESKLEEYSERRGLRVVEAWNDWGRFLKIMKLRPVFVSEFSP